ncbi:MAG TPA: hypothetical protein VIH21_00710, partial [Dehalococcoidia bacterium]
MPATSRRRPFQPEDNYLLKRVLDPQISPDGARVAYVVQRNDREVNERQTSIFVARMDGKQKPRRFTFGKKDHSPRWSPDGRYLAFVADRGDKNQIYLAPLDGGEARQLTKQPHGAGDPAWSPDAKHVAFVARTGDYKEPKERDATEKTAPRVIHDLRYRFDGIGYFDERRMHVFVAEVESRDAKQITHGDWHDAQPSWSPDGKTIVFSSDRERARFDRGWSDAWSVSAFGGRARKLTRSRGAANFPSFSPDGRWIAFAGHEHGEAGSAKNTHIMVVPSSGGAAPRSVSAPLDQTLGGGPTARPFTWSSDSKSIIFLAQERGTMPLYRASVSGKRVERVVGGDRQIQQFAVSSDGAHVAFAAAWSSVPSELYVASLDSGTRERNISHANDAFLDTASLATTKRMTSKAPDGLSIESLVLYPPDYKLGRRYPAV